MLDWLDGHPLAMRLTLPRLQNTDPAGLLAALRGIAPLPGGDAGMSRLSSLGACITYSFAHLAAPARRLLPALSLFTGVADEDVLMRFSAVEGVPGRFAGTSQQGWTAVLEDAARVGLLSPVGGGMYRIHPALPGYLAAAWYTANPGGYEKERQAAEQALRAARADFGDWLTGQIRSEDAAHAYTVIGLQRRTFGAMLGHALDHHAWDDADKIVRALEAYGETRGLGAEATAWTDRIPTATAGPGQVPDATAESLWLYTLGQQAARQQVAGQAEPMTVAVSGQARSRYGSAGPCPAARATDLAGCRSCCHQGGSANGSRQARHNPDLARRHGGDQGRPASDRQAAALGSRPAGFTSSFPGPDGRSAGPRRVMASGPTTPVEKAPR